MTRKEFSDVTNLVKLRGAYQLLTSTYYPQESRQWSLRRKAIVAIEDMVKDLEESIRVDDQAEA